LIVFRAFVLVEIGLVIQSRLDVSMTDLPLVGFHLLMV
jgi:hypothetical protein